MTFQLEIITPQREAFSKPVHGVYVPTKQGTIGVLPRHERLFTSLTEGEVKIIMDGKDWYLAIGGGFMEVTKEKVSILVSRAVHADELNEAEIKKAQQEAKEALANKGKGQELADAQAILRRSMLELRVVRRNVHRRGLPTAS
jgi:F-type H+-transporting ATPase subunit epsilon